MLLSLSESMPTILIHWLCLISSRISALVPTPSGNLLAASLAKQRRETIPGLLEWSWGWSLGLLLYDIYVPFLFFLTTGPTIEVVPSSFKYIQGFYGF